MQTMFEKQNANQRYPLNAYGIARVQQRQYVVRRTYGMDRGLTTERQKKRYRVKNEKTCIPAPEQSVGHTFSKLFRIMYNYSIIKLHLILPSTGR